MILGNAGHTDSANSVQFLPYSNILLSASADKTVSIWDARAGLCAHTFYGHTHAVSHAVYNIGGDTIASCDAFGHVKMWDVRHVSPMIQVRANCLEVRRFGEKNCHPVRAELLESCKG